MKRWRRRVSAHTGQALAGVTWRKPPASASPRVPGTAPARDMTPAPAPGHTPGAGTPFDPPSMTPAPGPKRTLSVHYYDDGHAEMFDHRRRVRIRIPGEPPAADWDGWLERLLRDQH